MREGSPHEEIALVDALAKIIHRVDDMKGDIADALTVSVVIPLLRLKGNSFISVPSCKTQLYKFVYQIVIFFHHN